MDVMYGSGSEYDLSLQELMEYDLRRMSKIDLTDFDKISSLPVFSSEDSFEDLDVRFDGINKKDFIGINIRPFVKSGINNNGKLPFKAIRRNPNMFKNARNVHRTPSKMLNAKSIKGIKLWNQRKSNPEGDFSYSFLPSPTNHGPLLEDQIELGILVNPSTVVPVSVASSAASSIGSETDPECFGTDDDESEPEVASHNLTAWVLPSHIESRTPSPVDMEVSEPYDEPEFLISTNNAAESVAATAPQKKKKQNKHVPVPHTDGKIYPKPAFSYSCLIAMALKNSKTGSLPVSEIYKFMCDHFPYFKSAPSGWKNSVRHNLSLNKCFEKVEKPGGNATKKGCLWALNPQKIHKMDDEVQKWLKKDLASITNAMSDPENLELIEQGELKRDYSASGTSDDDDEEELSDLSNSPSSTKSKTSKGSTDSKSNLTDNVATTASVQPVQVQGAGDTKYIIRKDPNSEFSTITGGNHLICSNSTGNTATYTLNLSNLSSIGSAAPIIIRRAHH